MTGIKCVEDKKFCALDDNEKKIRHKATANLYFSQMGFC